MFNFNFFSIQLAQPNKAKQNQTIGQESETSEPAELEVVDQTEVNKKPIAVNGVTVGVVGTVTAISATVAVSNGIANNTREIVSPNLTGTAETMPSTFIGINGYEEQPGQPEALNKKALSVINRVRDKLTGRDFNPNEKLAVPQQVDLLIKQATSKENLCQCYIGWCPFW